MYLICINKQIKENMSAAKDNMYLILTIYFSSVYASRSLFYPGLYAAVCFTRVDMLQFVLAMLACLSLFFPGWHAAVCFSQVGMPQFVLPRLSCRSLFYPGCHAAVCFTHAGWHYTICFSKELWLLHIVSTFGAAQHAR